MIDPQDRFWVNGSETDGVERKSCVLDWDQRRCYTIIGPDELLAGADDDAEDKEIEILKRCINELGEDDYAITVDEQGSLVSVSSDPEDDTTFVVSFPSYLDAPSLQCCSILDISTITELDRLGQGVDLVAYTDRSGRPKSVVFKYSLIFQWVAKIWNEVQVLKDIPEHPNIIPLDCIIVDGSESEILGFTTTYIPGGNLEDNTTRPFRLAWLRQLTDVVDYLNLELGIVHQDIAPRNLLIDTAAGHPEHDKLRLFDFDRAAYVGSRAAWPDRNDIKGVIFTLYEILTQDDSFRKVPFEEQDPSKVLELKHWPLKCELDSDVGLFREHLSDWVIRRSQKREGNDRKDCHRALPPQPAPRPIIERIDGDTGEQIFESWPIQRRASAVKLGRKFFSWVRPPMEVFLNNRERQDQALARF